MGKNKECPNPLTEQEFSEENERGASCFSEIRSISTIENGPAIRRSRLEIELDILFAISRGNQLQSSIIRNANIDYVVFASIRDHLLAKNLIGMIPRKRKYLHFLTKKGLQVVNTWSWFRKQFSYDIEGGKPSSNA